MNSTHDATPSSPKDGAWRARAAALAFVPPAMLGHVLATAGPAAAQPCMVNCWTEDGKWQGGGGLRDFDNPDLGSGGGGSDGGRVGGGGYEGPRPDVDAPSGTGWDGPQRDPRGPEGEDPQAPPQPATVEGAPEGPDQAPIAQNPVSLSTDVEDILDILGGGTLTDTIEHLKEVQRTRDHVFDDPAATQDERDKAQRAVDRAEERLNRSMSASCGPKWYSSVC